VLSHSQLKRMTLALNDGREETRIPRRSKSPKFKIVGQNPRNCVLMKIVENFALSVLQTEMTPGTDSR
jgi:hypothetical protein